MQTRKTKRFAVRASRLNTQLKTGSNPTMIYPSVTANFDAKELAAHAVTCSCGDCGFEFTSVSALNGQGAIKPVCANCGSGKVEAKTVTSALESVDESVLAAVQCPACETYLIQSEATASAMAADYHCILCGKAQVLAMEGDVDPSAEPEQEVVEDTTVDATAADGDALTDDVSVDETTEDPFGVASAETVVQPTLVPAAPVVEPVVMSDPTPAVVEPTAVAETEDDLDDLSDLEDSFPDGTDSEEEFDFGDETDVDATAVSAECDENGVCTDDEELGDDSMYTSESELDATIDGDNVQFELLPNAQDVEMSFVYVGDKLHAFANGLQVASLSQAKAGKNANLFNTDVLVRSVVAQCRETSIRQGLVSAGFEMVSVSIPVGAFVTKKVNAAIAASQKKQVAAVKSTKGDWEQAIAIALAGLNKGFFAGRDNPLKSGLVSELSALGVRNPSKLIDKVFAAHGSKFNTAVLELASDLHGKTIDVRNQLSETLDSTNYMGTVEDESEDDEFVDLATASVADRLRGAGARPVTVQSSTGSKAVASSGSTVSRLLAANGGSLFSKTSR